ncbi:hypothetical protein AC1031_003057 [Aphanomyces cochlioides]|nr:hypothetical protein AC1031_003057 [Aphanomyces cochlioides]
MQESITTTSPISLPDSNTRTTPVSPLREFPVYPEAIFDTPEEAQAAINLFARNHGYAVIRLRTVLDKNLNIRRVVLACDRHGVYKPSKSTPGTKKVMAKRPKNVRQNNPQILLRKSDVYNAKRKETLKRIGSNTRTQHLLNELQKNGDFSRHRLDIQGRLSHLFFASREVLVVFKANYDIIMLDCTEESYNQYHAQLRTFDIGQATYYILGCKQLQELKAITDLSSD